jgi:predicted MFS family arabinose efflux permease
MLNGVWAAANVIGPIAGGALAQLAGRSSVYVVLTVASVIAALWLVPRRRATAATTS